FDIFTSQMVIVPTEGSGAAVSALSSSDANSVLAVAEQMWTGANGVPAATFAGVTVNVGTLPANVAAETSGKQITVAADGAGWGWNTNPYNTPAADKLDLLTVLLEQLGTIAGVTGNGSPDDVMNQVLKPGVQRLPGPADVPGKNNSKLPGSPPQPPPLSPQQVANLLQSSHAVDVSVYSGLVSAAPTAPSADTLVTTFNSIDVFQAGPTLQPLLLKTVTVDNQGNALKFSGSYSRQIVFSDDGTLAYIAGSNDKIYVFDTETQDIVATYTVEGSSAPISSLAFNNGWLYVSQGSNYGNGGQLVRVDVDQTSSDFLSKQQTLDIPYAVAPIGFEGLAV